MSEKLKTYAPAVIRIGVALVILWFGIEQLINASDWTGWLPSYSKALPFSPVTLVHLNGIFETIFGALLFFGLFTRTAAALLALHMAHIITVVGYGEIGARDFAIFAGALSAAFNGADKLCLDSLFSKRENA